MRVVCRVHGLGPSYTLKQNVFSYSFDSIIEAHESKKGHLWTLQFVPLTTRAPVP